MTVLDRIKGSLWGGAIGDALGYPVEFATAEDILRICGKGGITEYVLQNGKACVSDDTQMTMFTAEGMLRAKAEHSSPSIEDYVKELHKSYCDWLETQTWAYNAKIISEHSVLLNTKEMYALRAPGSTCLLALESGRCGSFDFKINDSKGCGGVMRVAPIALLLAPDKENSLEMIDVLAARAAAITHGHELGYIPAAFFAHVISAILRGQVLCDAIQEAKTAVRFLFGESENMKYFCRLVDKAITLATNESTTDDARAISELGEGNVAEETVAIAVYCSLKYENNFERAIVASVNHSGDSDSTGAVTGNIIGAIVGPFGIPEKYLEPLELKNELERLANELASA